MHKFQTKYNPTIIAIFLISIMTMLLFKIQDTYLISLCLLFIGLLIVPPLPFQQWTFIDLALGSIMCFNIISCFYSRCKIPTIHQGIFSVICMTSYLILRRAFNIPHFSQIFLKFSLLPIGIVFFFSLCSFFIFRSSVLYAEFDNIYHFRFLFRPIGYAVNVWAELLLIILGWVCLTRHFSTIFCFLVTSAIMISFSRGVYIALFVYLIMWAIMIKPIKRKLKILIASLSAILIISIVFPTETKTTLSINSTASQQRSTEWRINTIESTLKIIKEYPLFGHGNDNYTFAIDRSLSQDSTQNKASFAPNILVLLLIEKGIAGTLFYLVLVIAISIYLWKHRNLQDTCIIGCTLLALFIKEMTQATLTYTPIICFFLYILLAFLQKNRNKVETMELQENMEKSLVAGLVIITFIGNITFNYLLSKNEDICKDSFAELAKGNTTNAAQLIEKTGKQVPYLIQRGILYTECYLKTKEQTYADKAELSLAEAHERQPKDVHINYLQAYLYLQKGENEKASSLLTKLATCYPKNSLFLYTLGENFYRNGKKKEALAYWVDAIYLTPRLLSMKRITNLQYHDQVFYDSLKYQLCTLDTIKLRTPIDWARYGYIMYWYGNQQTATLYLKKAVTLLPNLATPWHLLGEEKKYRLLTFGAFQGDSSYVPHEQEMTDKRLLYLAYKFKFQSWYGCCLSEY